MKTILFFATIFSLAISGCTLDNFVVSVENKNASIRISQKSIELKITPHCETR